MIQSRRSRPGCDVARAPPCRPRPRRTRTGARAGAAPRAAAPRARCRARSPSSRTRTNCPGTSRRSAFCEHRRGTPACRSPRRATARRSRACPVARQRRRRRRARPCTRQRAPGLDQCARVPGLRCHGEELLRRGSERHVDRVEPVDRGQQSAGPGHPRADLQQRPAHPPRDLGAHDGVVEVLLRLVEALCAASSSGARVVHVLLRDRVLRTSGSMRSRLRFAFSSARQRAAIGGVVAHLVER